MVWNVLCGPFIRRLTVESLLLALCAGAVNAAILRVRPGGDDSADGLTWATAKKTIQAGITAASASPPGQLWVAQGTYPERITLGNDVSLLGGFHGDETNARERSLDPNLTIIDGGAGGSVVTVPAGANTVVVDTVTIRNGTGTAGLGSLRYGGGILINNASPTIRNCVITANTAVGPSSQGAGIYITGGGAAPIIERNILSSNVAGYQGGGLYTEFAAPTISGNTFLSNSARNGGGFCAATSGTPTLVSNTFQGNTARFGAGGYVAADGSFLEDNIFRGNDARTTRLDEGYGGGLFVYFVKTPFLLRNTYYGNSANYGGALAIRQASPIVRSSVIQNNAADVEGGGLWVNGDYPNPDFTARPLVANNTLVGNTAPAGGAMHFSLRSTPRIVNNIAAFNGSGLAQATGAAAILNNNDVFGNNGADYTGLAPDGNDIAVDPLFYDDLADNLRLTTASPCVDAGDNTVAGPADRDRDGAARIQAGAVDLGAYETPAQTAFSAGDIGTALRIAGGLARASLEQSVRINIVIDGPSAGRIDVSDAARLMRKVAGLEPNP